MFSFHKPKVYRSTTGCCICKAKSSSSRFTDSKKYETDFLECFQLTTPRKGEICNACVLLVKRYKRLPPGNNRHWGHVVDARVGPGLKSMTKFKKRKEESLQKQQSQNGDKVISNKSSTQNEQHSAVNGNGTSSSKSSITCVPERFCKIFKKTKKKQKSLTIITSEKKNNSGSSDEVSTSPTSPTSDYENDMNKFSLSNNQDTNDLMKLTKKYLSNGNVRGKNSNMNHNNNNSNQSNRIGRKYRRKNYSPFKNRGLIDASFIDDNLWQKRLTCCGYVYENALINAVMIDVSSQRVCPHHSKNLQAMEVDNEKLILQQQQQQQQQMERHLLKTDIISDCLTHDEILTKILDVHLKSTGASSSPITSNMNNVNNTSAIKVTDSFNTNTSAVKKHHLYSKRQQQTNNSIVNDKTELSSSSAAANATSKDLLNYAGNLPGASYSVIKSDISNIKNLVKVCTEKSTKLKNGNSDNSGNNSKFVSDNSSDSGYEEIPQDHIQSAPRPLVLANGVKVHVQPQNLMLAANLAGVSQKTLGKKTVVITSQFAANPVNDNILIVQNCPTLQQQSQQQQLQTSSLNNLKSVIKLSPASAGTATTNNSSIIDGNLNNIVLIKSKYLQQPQQQQN